MLSELCEEQPPVRLSEAIAGNDELRSAFGFPAASEPALVVSTTSMLTDRARLVENRSRNTHACVFNGHPLCISTVVLGPNQSNFRDKVCIVQDQSVYNELQKEKLAIQCMKDFFAMITHELRNPLQGVLGLFESIMDELREEGLRQSCRMGVSTVKLMMGLIGDILDMSQLEANSFRLVEADVDMRELVLECVELMNFKYKMKGVMLRCTVETTLPQAFRCDRNRYMQVLLNLLGNALKFTDRGEVCVAMGYDPQCGKLMTAVRDTGRGIKDEDKGKLFALFGKLADSAHINSQGCGLGLYICKKLVEAMGGEIKLDSEYMKGTTITYSILNKRVLDANPKDSSTEKLDLSLSIPNEGNALNSSYFGLARCTEGALWKDGSSPMTRPQPEELRALVVDDEVMCSTVVRAHLRHYGLVVDTVSFSKKKKRLINFRRQRQDCRRSIWSGRS